VTYLSSEIQGNTQEGGGARKKGERKTEEQAEIIYGGNLESRMEENTSSTSEHTSQSESVVVS